MVYLDNAASTPIREEVLTVLHNSFQNEFFNPSAAYRPAKKLSESLDSYRHFILDKLGLKSEDYALIFTSSSTESNNLAIFSHAKSKNILSSQHYHASLWKPLQELHKDGADIVQIPLTNGRCALDELTTTTFEKIDFAVLNHVCGLSGIVSPLESMVQTIRAHAGDCPIHLDAVQSFGKLPCDFSKLDLETITIGSHKIGGPKGVSALIYKKSSKITPRLFGGGQEFELRSSTVAFPLIAAMTKAIQCACDELELFQTKTKILFDQLIMSELSTKKMLNFKFSGHDHAPFICLAIIDGLPSDVIMRQLERHDTYVSSSTACSSRNRGFNPAYELLGIDKNQHKNILRISFGWNSSEHDVQVFIKQYLTAYKKLKNITGR